jgi:LysR family transcriptional regulator, carnitine catabolism transcriptional activator
MNLKLEQLRVFVAVAECGAIAEAAEQIGRTASAVSMTLSQIENQLAGKLFEGERKSRLTPLGKFTLQRATLAVEAHQRASNDIQRFASGEEGLSKIAVVPSVATRVLPQAINQLRQELPHLEVDIRDIDSHAIHDVIQLGLVDFGIASPPADDSLHADFLLKDSYRLICRKDHRLNQLGRPVKLSDIDVQEFIVNGLCERIVAPGIQSIIEKSSLYIHNTLSILAFIEAGFGVTILPALTRPRGQGFAAVPIDNVEMKRSLYVLKRKSLRLSPIDLRLIEVIRSAVASLNLD